MRKVNQKELQLLKASDELVLSQAAVLPGSFDKARNPVLILPPSRYPNLIKLSQENRLNLLKYYTYLSRLWFSVTSLSILVDLRDATQETTALVLSTVQDLQASVGKVSVVYIILPINKAVKKFLSKEIYNRQKSGGLSFQITVLKNNLDLQTYIDPSQLINYFGGTLDYDHNAWFALQKHLEDFYSLVEEIKAHLPYALEHLANLKKLVASSDVNDLDLVMQQVEVKKSQIQRSLHLDQALREGDLLIECTNKPYLDNTFLRMAKYPLYQPMMATIPLYYGKLIDAKRKMDKIWSEAKTGVEMGRQANVVQLEEDMRTIIRWIKQEGSLQLERHNIVATSLKEAQILHRKFDSEISPVAQDKITQGKEMLKLANCVPSMSQTEHSSVQTTAQLLAKTLTTFRQHLDQRRDQIQITVNYFSVITKAEKWYQNASKFLSNPHSSESQTYQHSLRDFLFTHPPLPKDELLAMVTLGDRMNSVREGNSSRLLATRCEELEQVLKSPERQKSEYTYIDERDSGVYSLRNGLRKSTDLLQRNGTQDNFLKSTSPRGYTGRSMMNDDRRSRPRGGRPGQFSPSELQGSCFREDPEKGEKEFYCQRNKRSRPAPVRQVARDEDTSSAYSTYGIPKQNMRIRQSSSDKEARLLEEQRRLEQELEKLKEMQRNSHLNTFDDLAETRTKNMNIHKPNIYRSLRYEGKPHHSSRLGPRDTIDVEVANLIHSEKLPPRPDSIPGDFSERRTIFPVEYNVNKDEGYEELSVDYPIENLRYQSNNQTNQPIRILLSAPSPEYDSMLWRLTTKQSVLSYYKELRARESNLKEQIRLNRRTLEHNLDSNTRQDIEQQYFDAQRKLNVMEKELVKLFTFLSPDMLQLLRNSESKKGVLSANNHVVHHSSYGIMGSQTDGRISSPVQLSPRYGDMVNQTNYADNTSIQPNLLFENGFVGMQNGLSHAFGYHVINQVQSSSNQNAAYLPVPHPPLLSKDDPRAGYPGGGMNEMSGIYGMNKMQNFDTPEGSLSPSIYYGANRQFQENLRMNGIHGIHEMHDRPLIPNTAPLSRARDINTSNYYYGPTIEPSPVQSKSPLSISLEDKQTQTFRDDRISLREKSHAMKDASVTNVEQPIHGYSSVHYESNGRASFLNKHHESLDASENQFEEPRRIQTPLASEKNDWYTIYERQDAGGASMTVEEQGNSVTPSRQPIPLSREYAGTTHMKSSPAEVTPNDLTEIKKERKLPKPAPRNKAKENFTSISKQPGFDDTEVKQLQEILDREQRELQDALHQQRQRYKEEQRRIQEEEGKQQQWLLKQKEQERMRKNLVHEANQEDELRQEMTSKDSEVSTETPTDVRLKRLQYFKSHANTQTFDATDVSPSRSKSPINTGSDIEQPPNKIKTKPRKHGPSSDASSSVGSIRDIDFEPSDRVSDESLVSTEQEVIELLKKAFHDELDRKDKTDSSEERASEDDRDEVDGAERDDIQNSSDFGLESYHSQEGKRGNYSTKFSNEISVKGRPREYLDSDLQDTNRFKIQDSDYTNERPTVDSLSCDESQGIGNPEFQELDDEGNERMRHYSLSSEEREALHATALSEEDLDDLNVDSKTASMEEFELLEKMLREEKEQQRMRSEEKKLLNEEEKPNDETEDQASSQVPGNALKSQKELKLAPISESKELTDDESLENTKDNDVVEMTSHLPRDEQQLIRNENSVTNSVSTLEQNDLLDLIGSGVSSGSDELEDSRHSNNENEFAKNHERMASLLTTAGSISQSALVLPVATPSMEHLAAFERSGGNIIIIDNGSGMCKAGFSNEEYPRVVFPAVVGRPHYKEAMAHEYEDSYVGDAAQSMRGVLTLNYPMENGIVTNWDDMELVWENAFDQLRVMSSDYPVMLTEAPLNPKRNRERMIQLMFETYSVPCIYVAVQAVMALYASGRTTGTVFDCGDGVSHTVPVYEGYMLPHATQRLNLAGRDITSYLQRLVTERGYSFKTSAEHQIIRDVKEELCYVAQDFEKELDDSEKCDDCEAVYTLPDGSPLHIGNERFRAPEALFKPGILGQDIDGIHESIFKCIKKCDIDIRQELFQNLLLSGGSTLFPGFSSRLHKELYSLVNRRDPSRVRVVSPEDRKFSVWRGSAVLANLPTFSHMCISAKEYDDFGPDIVHRKCF